eukprot:8434658-Karenia_brevis.AAC.1
MHRGSGVCETPLRIPSSSSSSDRPPRTYGEQMKSRGAHRRWSEDAMVDDEEDSSSSSSSSKKDEP